MSESDALDRIADATELLVKLLLRQAKGEQSQTEMILLLNSFGCAPGQIAEYLGTPTTTVYPTLSKARRRKSK